MTEVYCAFLDRRAEAWWSFVQQKSLDRTSRPMMLLPKDKKRQKNWNNFRNPKNQNEELWSSVLTTLPPNDLLAVPPFRIFFIYSYSIAFLKFILKSIFILFVDCTSCPMISWPLSLAVSPSSKCEKSHLAKRDTTQQKAREGTFGQNFCPKKF